MAEIILETAADAQTKVDTHNSSGTAHSDIRALIAATPDATGSVKGKVQLAGDLGGTAASPTVPGLAAKADASATTTALAGKTPNLTQSAVKTGIYTAADNEIVVADTTGGTFTITGPTSGARFGVRWKAGTVAPTVAAPAGYTIVGAATVTPGLAPGSTSGELLTWQAFSTDYQVIDGYKPQAALDTKYITTERTAVRTLTNARVTKRIGTTASSSTPTADADNHDGYTVTAAAANMTVGAPTGTPTTMQMIMYRFLDNGTARTIAWNAIFRAVGTTLPTTTVLSKTLYVLTIWNEAASKWDVISTGQE